MPQSWIIFQGTKNLNLNSTCPSRWSEIAEPNFKRSMQRVNHYHIKRTRILVFQRDFWRKHMRFRIHRGTFRDFGRVIYPSNWCMLKYTKFDIPLYQLVMVIFILRGLKKFPEYQRGLKKYPEYTRDLEIFQIWL